MLAAGRLLEEISSKMRGVGAMSIAAPPSQVKEPATPPPRRRSRAIMSAIGLIAPIAAAVVGVYAHGFAPGPGNDTSVGDSAGAAGVLQRGTGYMTSPDN